MIWGGFRVASPQGVLLRCDAAGKAAAEAVLLEAAAKVNCYSDTI